MGTQREFHFGLPGENSSVKLKDCRERTKEPPRTRQHARDPNIRTSNSHVLPVAGLVSQTARKWRLLGVCASSERANSEPADFSAGLYSGAAAIRFRARRSPRCSRTGIDSRAQLHARRHLYQRGSARASPTSCLTNSEAAEEDRITANSFSAVVGRTIPVRRYR